MISLISGMLKNGTNELIYKQGESHNVENNLMVPGEKGGMNCDIGIDMYTHIYKIGN